MTFRLGLSSVLGCRKRSTRSARYAALVAMSTAVASCVGGQARMAGPFSLHWSDEQGRALRALQPTINAIPVPNNADVVVGVVEQGLVGAALPNGRAWSFSHVIDSRPAVAGNVVVATGANELFALDATTGERLWVRPAGGKVRGIGDDGRTTVISMTQGVRGSVVLAVERSGTVLRQIESAATIGVPAVRGPFVFLPWLKQYVTIYDLTSGTEAARILVREPVSRAFTIGRKLYFAEKGAFRFDETIVDAPAHRASYYPPPERTLPGEPVWFTPGTSTRPASADALDKVELLARPASDRVGKLDSDRYAALYFSYALGFDARTNELSWVHTHDSDLIAGSAYAGGTAVCDAKGKVWLVEARTGALAKALDLGRPLRACVLQTDGLTVRSSQYDETATRVPEGTDNAARTSQSTDNAARTSQAADTSAAPRLTPLLSQLSKAMASREGEFLAVKRLLISELARQDGSAATKLLVDWLVDPRALPALRGDLQAALRTRRNGADHVERALDRHYDFLKGVEPPPVGALAEALAAMKATHGAQVLASHLLDPADSPRDLRSVAAALAQLGTPEVASEVRTFFALHRTTADDEDTVAALADVARVLLRIGGADGRHQVERAAKDPATVDALRETLAAILTEPSARPGE